MNTVVGKKTEQTQRFLTDGTRIPVTVITVPAMRVVGIKTLEKDGYSAVQVAYGTKKRATKSVIGHVKKAKMTEAPAYIREMEATVKDTLPEVGTSLVVAELLKPGDVVKVIGVSKGKGFAGVVKRHNFRGGPKTHGQSDRHRAPGSIGQTTTPGRVYKGKRMAGRMGSETVSVLNLVVMDIADVNGQIRIFVKGLVPGNKNALVTIEKTGEQKKHVALLKDEIQAEAQTEQK